MLALKGNATCVMVKYLPVHVIIECSSNKIKVTYALGNRTNSYAGLTPMTSVWRRSHACMQDTFACARTFRQAKRARDDRVSCIQVSRQSGTGFSPNDFTPVSRRLNAK